MLQMIDSLLAPLARLLVARGVGFADISERLKGHYVRAAMQQTEAGGQKLTDSRLSVLTGLHRRDVARLRAFEEKPPRPSPLTRLVALWSNDPRYRGLALARTGPDPSFETLAREVIQDIHPRTLLDTLLEAGTCLDDGQKIHLQSAAYIPAVGSDGQIAYLAANVGDHLAAATENVLGHATPPHFERALHLSALTHAEAATLSQRYEVAQMELLDRLQNDANTMKNSATPRGNIRFRAGGYVFTKAEKETP